MSLPPPSHRGRAVVTGASSGIGAELARSLARRGHSLIVVARRQDRLTELATSIERDFGVAVEVRPCDLTDRAARTTLADELATRDISILVNNAGVASYGPIQSADPDHERREVELDVNAVHDLVLAVLPGMLERRQGAFLITGSTAGFQPGPNNATYAASKAFANIFAESLHSELAGTGVTCTLLAPGPVRTEFADTAGIGSATAGVPTWLFENPASVAEAAVRGMDRNARRITPGAIATAQSVLGALTPTSLTSPLLRTVYRRISS